MRRSIILGAFLAGVTSLPLLALFYLGQQVAGLPFVPFGIFDWLVRVLPGGMVTAAIETLVRVIRLFNLGPIGSAAKLIEQLLAVALSLAGAGLFGGTLAALVRLRWARGWLAGLAGGVLVFLLASMAQPARVYQEQPLLAILWPALLLIGWGTLLGWWLDSRPARGEAVPPAAAVTRRALLRQIVGGSLAVALLAWTLGRLVEGRRAATGADRPLAGLGAIEAGQPMGRPGEATAVVDGRLPPVPGTRAEITADEDFYRIDINLLPPVVDGKSWVLQVAGLFDRPRDLTLSDLMAYPPVRQPVTLGCISNPIGGDLISTSYWTGVRLGEVLRDLGLRPEAKALSIEATDGFFETVVMDDMLDPRTLLVYAMGDRTLFTEHGFPLRIYIPNRYGMKQPKWITRLEATATPRPGYWVERGWSREARPQIVSVIDVVDKDHPINGRIGVGGIAWAGDRGIQRVEVQVDGGPWEEARLRLPTPGPLTWVQWRYDWPAQAGAHSLRVRATDGSGDLQIEEERDVLPSGATGYHSVAVVV